MSTEVDVFVDYVCPFCMLAEAPLKELGAERDVEVVVRPFELRPDPVPTLRPEDGYLPRIWKESVYPLAERLGIPIRLPTISPQPRSEKAFMVLQLAQEEGKAAEYSDAIFRAFFQADRDIGDDGVIVDVARSVGLSGSDVGVALRSDERRARQRAAQEYAVNTVGVNSVPAVRIGGRLLPGVPGAVRLKQTVDALSAIGDGR